MNWLGPVAALAAFFGIWFGHVAVRKIEFSAPTLQLPGTLFALTGIALEWFSLCTSNFLLSATTGILGFTFLWDALELTRQQNRIKKGHAPANPDNPRHARILQEHASATTVDLLKRDPLGKPVSPNEAAILATKH